MPVVPGTPEGVNPLTGQPLYHPLIKVTIQVVGFAPLTVDALVDSGADITTVPSDVLVAMGVDVAKLPILSQVTGLGGTFPQRRCVGEIAWRNWRFCGAFAVVDPLQRTVVGQADFFKEFSVDFRPWRNDPPSLTITHYAGKKHP